MYKFDKTKSIWGLIFLLILCFISKKVYDSVHIKNLKKETDPIVIEFMKPYFEPYKFELNDKTYGFKVTDAFLKNYDEDETSSTVILSLLDTSTDEILDEFKHRLYLKRSSSIEKFSIVDNRQKLHYGTVGLLIEDIMDYDQDYIERNADLSITDKKDTSSHSSTRLHSSRNFSLDFEGEFDINLYLLVPGNFAGKYLCSTEFASSVYSFSFEMPSPGEARSIQIFSSYNIYDSSNKTSNFLDLWTFDSIQKIELRNHASDTSGIIDNTNIIKELFDLISSLDYSYVDNSKISEPMNNMIYTITLQSEKFSLAFAVGEKYILPYNRDCISYDSSTVSKIINLIESNLNKKDDI